MDEVTPLAHVASGNEAIGETTPDRALTISCKRSLPYTSRGRGRGRGSRIPRAAHATEAIGETTPDTTITTNRGQGRRSSRIPRATKRSRGRGRGGN
jgi:hypothetical protein